jgi:hypothetical protein
MPRLGKSAVVDTSALESDLKVLAANSKNLNRLTDELSGYIAQVESTVNALNPGLKVSVIVERSSDEDGTWSHYVRLGYDKIDGRWGLSIDEYDENEEDPADSWVNRKTWAFNDAPRSLRLMVVPSIPDLIKALVKESESMSAETAATVSRAKEIAASLSKSGPTLAGK